MPAEFSYPTSDWAAGTMRKVGDTGANEPPTLNTKDWGNFWQGNWSVIGPSGTVDPSKADPNGLVIKKGHPQIKELEDSGWESYSIPEGHGDWGKDYQFMRPPAKGTPVAGSDQKMAKMLPTQGQAQQVITESAGRSRGKRKEAEAM